eukprot:751868-Pelagomonas_calceolata.AAC.2
MGMNVNAWCVKAPLLLRGPTCSSTEGSRPSMVNNSASHQHTHVAPSPRPVERSEPRHPSGLFSPRTWLLHIPGAAE